MRFEVFLLLALSDVCECVFPVPASPGRAHMPHGLSWELVRGEDSALYSRGAQLAWERDSCLGPPLLWFPEGGPVRCHLSGWACFLGGGEMLPCQVWTVCYVGSQCVVSGTGDRNDLTE